MIDYEVYQTIEPIMRAIEKRGYQFDHETIPALEKEGAHEPSHTQILSGIKEVALELGSYLIDEAGYDNPLLVSSVKGLEKMRCKF